MQVELVHIYLDFATFEICIGTKLTVEEIQSKSTSYEARHSCKGDTRQMKYDPNLLLMRLRV